MSDINEELVTCFNTIDPVAAGAVRSYLESFDIQCFLPDENLSGVARHLTGVIGGVRVQVKKSQLEEAKKALELYTLAEGEHLNEDDDEIEPDITGDIANRAFKTSIIGLFIWPFLHIYSFYLSIRAFDVWENLEKGEKTKNIFALIFSSLNILIVAILIARLV